MVQKLEVRGLLSDIMGVFGNKVVNITKRKTPATWESFYFYIKEVLMSHHILMELNKEFTKTNKRIAIIRNRKRDLRTTMRILKEFGMEMYSAPMKNEIERIENEKQALLEKSKEIFAEIGELLDEAEQGR